MMAFFNWLKALILAPEGRDYPNWLLISVWSAKINALPL
jgi:hypothetical protein